MWLREDLAAHPNKCTLAYWHHPFFSSGMHGNDLQYRDFWQDLYEIKSIIANSEVHDTQTYGVLKLTLRPTSYEWQFVPIAGQTFTDSGEGECK